MDVEEISQWVSIKIWIFKFYFLSNSNFEIINTILWHWCLFFSLGNLLKHYKERHPNSALPEALAELDRVVTVGMSKTIPPEERGLGGANGFFDSNDSTYLEEEQMNKSMVSVIFIVLD